MFTSPYDFAYPWWMTWGHLMPLVLFGLLALAGWRLAWRRWIVAVSGALAVWGLAGFLILNQVLVTSQPLPLPTARFLPSGAGRVLDMGAGSGRAALMVLLARPKTTVVALDIYSGYWGVNDNTPERLKRNAAAGGVADRVDVRVADMRELPFPDESFDAAVSSFAIETDRMECELRGEEEVLASALRARDVGAFSRLLAQGYVFTSAKGETWGRDRAITDVSDPQLRIAPLAIVVEHVVPLGEVGVVTGRSKVEGHIGERSISGAFRFTHVWRRYNEQREIAAGDTSPAPPTA